MSPGSLVVNEKQCAGFANRVRFRTRRILFSLSEDEQQRLLHEWNASSLPGRAEYFADFIRRRTCRGVFEEDGNA